MKNRNSARASALPASGPATPPSATPSSVSPFPATARKSRARIGADYDLRTDDTRDLTSDVQPTPSDDRLAAAPIPTAVDDARAQRVAERAYYLYLSRGDQDGDAVTDWLTAERQIDEETE
jgi:hypothetical protein